MKKKILCLAILTVILNAFSHSQAEAINLELSTVSNANIVAKSNLPIEWQDEKYNDLLAAIASENYEEAFVEASILSSSGDAQVQCVLAAMYLCGAGTYRNYESAQELLAQAAEHGFRRGEYMLGGFGSLAMHHDVMKTILGEDFAQVDIDDNSFWYQMMSTDSKPDNFKDAFKWFLLEDGEWGYRDIMYYAGIALITGKYGYQNQEKGLMWVVESAKLGYDEAIDLLEQLYNAYENE